MSNTYKKNEKKKTKQKHFHVELKEINWKKEEKR